MQRNKILSAESRSGDSTLAKTKNPLRFPEKVSVFVVLPLSPLGRVGEGWLFA